MTQKPSSTEVLRALDDADAIMDIAECVLVGGVSKEVQISVATALRGARERLTVLANSLDDWMEKEGCV